MWGSKTQKLAYRYEHLDEIAGEEKASLNPSSNSRIDSRFRARCGYLLTPWIASTLTFLILSLYLFFTRLPANSSRPVFFDTDFPHARQAIEYETRTFSGAFNYNQTSGELYRELDDSKPQYFGDPTLVSGIDEAWEELMRGEFTAMSDEEAAAYSHPDFHRFQISPEAKSFYYFEPDMFHMLHCLNAIRRMLDHDFYDAHPELQGELDKHPPAGWMRLHRDHCLDLLMQSIQCHGDLSPTPLHSWAGFNIAFGVGQAHTCRNFDRVQEWRRRRHEMRPSIG